MFVCVRVCVRAVSYTHLDVYKRQEISNEVIVSYKNELTINSGKIVENEVFKGDTVKINSGDENIEIVLESKRDVYKRQV